jgi:ionotropic glutamate receptor
MPPQCTGKPQSGPKQKLSPLSLKNLTGAFVVLLVGLSLSLLAFLGERIVFIRQLRKVNELRQQKILIKVSTNKTEERTIVIE